MTALTASQEISDFKERLSVSLLDKTLNLASIKISKHKNVYLLGDQAQNVYFIDTGQIKLLMLSPEGKECLLCILTAGDTFGELCLAGESSRQEMATAMVDTTLRAVPSATFLLHLNNHSLVEGFVRYLAARISDQQQIIASLITMDSEHRLGETLLLLAQKIGKQHPRGKRIEQKITHEELSQMVGTTRPRITEFMLKFRSLGLISISTGHCLIVSEKKLAAYLGQVV